MNNKPSKKFLALILLVTICFISCSKSEDEVSKQISEGSLRENTIILSSPEFYRDLVSIDSTHVIVTDNDNTNIIQLESILVSDINEKAPEGFLRKVIAINVLGGRKICLTEQASLVDALKSARVRFQKNITFDNLILTDTSGVDYVAANRESPELLSINYNKTIDNLKIEGNLDLESTLYFDLDLGDNSVNNFKLEMQLKNTNSIKAEANLGGFQSIDGQYVIGTYQLRPFTIWIGPVPMPIAKQWIVLVIGASGTVSAKFSTSAKNVSTINLGVKYNESSGWNTISNSSRLFSYQPISFKGKAEVEAWLQARYELRPYGLKNSRMFLAARGSIIGTVENILNEACSYKVKLDWGLKLSAKAQMVFLKKTIINYDLTFYDDKFPIYSKTISSLKVETDSITEILPENPSSDTFSAKCGGTLTDSIASCNTQIIERGVCWDTLPNPNLAKSKTSNGQGVGNFISNLSNLKAGKKYYVKAFARSQNDTIYGDEREFKVRYNIGIDFTTLNHFSTSTFTVQKVKFSFNNTTTTQNLICPDSNGAIPIYIFNSLFLGGYMICDVSHLPGISTIFVGMNNQNSSASKVQICNAEGLIAEELVGYYTFNVEGLNPTKIIFFSYEGYPLYLSIQ